MNKITILGSGTSTGVPILGCKCAVCKSTDQRNKRLRTSAFIETASGKKILIDASPDLRTQLLRHNFDDVDAAIITHDHADHVHGIDDLRPFCFTKESPIPVYADEYTCRSLSTKFAYIFERHKVFAEKPILGGGIPKLDLNTVESEAVIQGEKFLFQSLPHGHARTLGIIHQKMGYIVDCQEVPESAQQVFRDAKLEILIIDCLREKPHQTHLHLDLTLEYIKNIGPKTAVLTHMAHEWDYVDLLTQLERRGIKNVFPAIDGQTFLY
jgi:phosphoribosyl 1,2-cyclic phosphate phosphodiesterase